MEIFVHNLGYSVTYDKLQEELAKILHSPPYTETSALPLNFHLHIYKDKRRTNRHSGAGALTLPTSQAGIQFLAEYGDQALGQRRVLNVGGRQVKFAKSKHTARPEVVENITRRPYISPKIVGRNERRDDVLDSAKVSIKTIQFGWECRDAVFSVEWEKSFEGQCYLYFDDDKREIRVKIIRISDTLIIAVRISQIAASSLHTHLGEQEVIFLSLDTPPAFESETKSSSTRQRLSALPIGDHALIVPYGSLAMRLLCSSRNDLEKFKDLARVAQLHSDSDAGYRVEHQGLFSPSALEELQVWLRRLNWCVSFQIESIVRSLAVDVKEMLSLMPHILRLIRIKGKDYAASMLRHFGPRAKELRWDPYDTQEETIEECFISAERDFEILSKSLPIQPTDGSLFNAYHVIVTPTTMYLEGPFLERSNRVIRKFENKHQESFLRVSFMDESRLQYRFDRDIDGPAFIRSHVGRLLLGGLTIARRDFRFLAYSQSSLKEHSVWFVKPFRDSERGFTDAPTIIRNLGTFDSELMHCPARYGARLSQAFTATDASVTIHEVEEIIYLDDIKSESGKYCFTDGVGTISPQLALEMSLKLRTRRRRRHNKDHPRVFQVRFMGSKGMLSVDYSLQGRAICIRPSMIKFDAPHSTEIEIARAFDRPGSYFLNRPLIMLLEGLGIPYDVFKKFQDQAVQGAWESTNSLAQAARTLESHGLGSSYRIPSVMFGLDKLGINNIDHNQFYRRMLEYAINDILRVLKNDARIPIPGAWTLVGVADVHNFLKEGEIFACVKPIDRGIIYLEGPVLISRSPTIHPGDIQIVNAIGRPPAGSCFSKETLSNSVVFSVKGSRPLPSCLGGGDLDGDVYNLIPLDKYPQFKQLSTRSSALYEQSKRKLVDHESTMTDVAEFVMEYINSDVVGIVAINWLILADQSPKGIFDENCMVLSHLHSDAVDYPKSGNPVAIERIPKLPSRLRPDWNAPETVKPDSSRYYESQRAIGRLFRDVDLPVAQKSLPKARLQLPKERTVDELTDSLADLDVNDPDPDDIQAAIEAQVSQYIDVREAPSRDKIEYIQAIFHRYASELKTSCSACTLSLARRSLSEEEAIIGTIVQKTSQPRKRKDMMSKLREQTGILVRGVREELAGDDDLSSEEALERAWLAWRLSILERKSFGGESFGWVALGAIFEAIKEMQGT